MFDIFKFLFSQVISFLKMLFRLDVGGTTYGVMLCIIFILFPIVLAIIQFIKTSFVEEIDDAYDNPNSELRERLRYHGRHEPVGKHSKAYHDRLRYNKRVHNYPKHGRY